LVQRSKKPGGTKGRKVWPPPEIYGMIVAFLSITAYFIYLTLIVSLATPICSIEGICLDIRREKNTGG
jgi:hypothetical protein